MRIVAQGPAKGHGGLAVAAERRVERATGAEAHDQGLRGEGRAGRAGADDHDLSVGLNGHAGGDVDAAEVHGRACHRRRTWYPAGRRRSGGRRAMSGERAQMPRRSRDHDAALGIDRDGVGIVHPAERESLEPSRRRRSHRRRRS